MENLRMRNLQEIQKLASDSFRSCIQSEVESLIVKKEYNCEWDYNGSADKYSHTDWLVSWHLHNGGRIRVCIRPCACEDTFSGDGAVVIACCKLLADTQKSLILVFIKLNDVNQWRLIKPDSVFGSRFDVLDDSSHYRASKWSYSWESINGKMLQEWIQANDVLTIIDDSKKVRELGDSIIGASSRKAQEPYMVKFRSILMPFIKDPYIRVLYNEFLSIAPKTTQQSQGSIGASSYARNYLRSLVIEVSSEAWKIESVEQRQEKASKFKLSL